MFCGTLVAISVFLKYAVMGINTSLCPSCEYFKTCVLTKNKKHIWNCNEFESADSRAVFGRNNLVFKSEVTLF